MTSGDTFHKTLMNNIGCSTPIPRIGPRHFQREDPYDLPPELAFTCGRAAGGTVCRMLGGLGVAVADV